MIDVRGPALQFEEKKNKKGYDKLHPKWPGPQQREFLLAGWLAKSMLVFGLVFRFYTGLDGRDVEGVGREPDRGRAASLP